MSRSRATSTTLDTAPLDVSLDEAMLLLKLVAGCGDEKDTLARGLEDKLDRLLGNTA